MLEWAKIYVLSHLISLFAQSDIDVYAKLVRENFYSHTNPLKGKIVIIQFP